MDVDGSVLARTRGGHHREEHLAAIASSLRDPSLDDQSMTDPAGKTGRTRVHLGFVSVSAADDHTNPSLVLTLDVGELQPIHRNAGTAPLILDWCQG